MTIQTILSPLELSALGRRDLRGTACVVFDILRATSTFVTALQHGAAGIIPVGEIPEAVTWRRANPKLLLAGERDGVRIRAAQSGGVDFDFGNSPREFTPERVRGRTIVSTTTNGTRALRACAGAKAVLAGSFLNLQATAEFLRRNDFSEALLVCAGTGDGVALEDVLAAGALVELLVGRDSVETRSEDQTVRDQGAFASTTDGLVSDSSRVSRKTFLHMRHDLGTAIGSSQNGRRLLSIPELRDDVAFCAQQNSFNLVAVMDAEGALRKFPGL